jgi:antitoxin HigA-1
MTDFAPTHPGEILAEEFLGPMGITAYRLAKEIDVPQTRLSEILAGRRSITADTGVRLSRALGLSDMFWINLQARYDATWFGSRSTTNWRTSTHSPRPRASTA